MFTKETEVVKPASSEGDWETWTDHSYNKRVSICSQANNTEYILLPDSEL